VSEDKWEFSRTSSNMCGITMSSGVEGNAISEVMDGKPGVKVSKFPAMVRIDGENHLEFDMEEIAEALGIPLGTVYSRLRIAREAFRQGASRAQARDRASARVSAAGGER